MNIKYTSRKFLAACWAALLITFLTVFCVITKYDPPWLGLILPFLSSTIIVWVGGEAVIDGVSVRRGKNDK